jgi:hypothetical protein
MGEQENRQWAKKFLALTEEERQERREKFFTNLKKELAKLEELLVKISGHWHYEDRVYRFYHGSFKLYDLQLDTLEIVGNLKSLLPEDELLPMFSLIIKEGTGKKFELEDNSNWAMATRPILEAFFHAKYFLEMLCKYGQEFEAWPEGPYFSGWAAICSLYCLW